MYEAPGLDRDGDTLHYSIATQSTDINNAVPMATKASEGPANCYLLLTWAGTVFCFDDGSARS